MTRTFTLLCFALVAVLVTGCSSPQGEQVSSGKPSVVVTPKATSVAAESTPPCKLALYIRDPNNPGSDASFRQEGKERLQILNAFTKAAGKLAREYGTPRHNEVVLFAVSQAQLLMPVIMENGNPNCVPYSPKMKDKPLGIQVVKPEDAEIGGFFALYASGKAGGAAMYQPEGERGSMLLSKELAGSEEGMALSFLHESFHAWQHLKEGKGVNMTPETYCQGEVEAHEFVGQVTNKKYPAVAKLVASTASLAGGKAEVKSIVVLSSTDIRRFVDERLDAAYGRKITNQSERACLRIDIFYRAYFLLFDELYPKEKRMNEKVKWLKSYLEGAGAAPWQKLPTSNP